MKQYIHLLNLTVVLCFSFISNAQLKISFNGFPNDEAQNVLFRGFDNILEITTNDEYFEYTISTTGIATTQVALSNDPKVKRYLIRVGKEKTATFSFIKKGEIAVFQTVTCQISNMPDPYIHFGGVPSGGKIPKTASSVSVKNLAKIRYDDSYQVTKFSMFIADEIFVSSNGELTEEMRKMLDQSISGDKISLNCYVLANDGITRLLGGTFTVE